MQHLRIKSHAVLQFNKTLKLMLNGKVPFNYMPPICSNLRL